MTPQEAIAQLQQLQKDSKGAMKRAEFRLANDIALDAIANVPERTGKLAESIGIDESGDTTTAYVGASYAPYVEYGTGPLVSIPSGLEEDARQFFVNGEGHTPAQPFFFPAVNKNLPNFQAFLDEELDKLTE